MKYVLVPRLLMKMEKTIMQRNKRGTVVKQKMLSILLLMCMAFSFFPCVKARAENIKLPNQTERIEAGAFENVPISELWLPDELRYIGATAFANTGLTTVVIPAGVSYIAPNAFEGCPNLAAAVYRGSYAEKWCSNNNIPALIITDLGVERHSQEEIRQFAHAHPAETNTATAFRRRPSLTEPYSPGLISEQSMQNALNMVNQVRFIAGLNADVVNAADREEMLGAAALVNYLNRELSHNPRRPEVLADSVYDELYEMAYDGASSSNLYAGMNNMANAVLGYLYDSNYSNISRVGHRRWILNPPMGKTTFGYCCDVSGSYRNSYSGMYAFDRSGSGRQAPVAWPAQQMPLSRFINAGTHAWSVSFDKVINMDAVNVTLIRESDGRNWHFSSESADGEFYVNNDWYGQRGCVIFRPSSIAISAGDIFRVMITDRQNKTALIYTVTFFDL